MALAADGLALARRERGGESSKRGVAGIFPVELLVGALQEIEFAEETESGSVAKVTWTPEAPSMRHSSTSPAASALRISSAFAPGRTNRRRPVAGVNGTATCSFG